LPARKIDGLDVWPVIAGEPNARNPHTGYATYYGGNELQSVTDGRWKLVLPHTYRTLGDQPKATGGKPARYKQEPITQAQLYDLSKDAGEGNDLATAEPAIVERLTKMAGEFRADLGDALTKTPATGARPPGQR
jgi:hypothetical protein